MVSAHPVPITLNIVPAIAPIFPEAVISAIMVMMYTGRPGMIAFSMANLTMPPNSQNHLLTASALVAFHAKKVASTSVLLHARQKDLKVEFVPGDIFSEVHLTGPAELLK